MAAAADADPPVLCFCRTKDDSWRVARLLERRPSVSGPSGKGLVVVQVQPHEDDPTPPTSHTLPEDCIESITNPEALLSPIDDLFTLPSLEPCAILNQTRIRYWKGKYFTGIGPILVTVNPYTTHTPLYGEANRLRYLQGAAEEPHLWLVAGRVYQRVQQEGNQCVLVSGESGSGKTFSIRVITNFLAEISTQHAPPGEQAEASRVANMQPKVGTLLEALGNAKTRRNRDSSRFAKFAKLKFNAAGYLCGCETECHLLEVSRILQHAAGERTFHVFYQLYATQRDHYRLDRCRSWLFQGCTEQAWERDEEGREWAVRQAAEVAQSFAALHFTAEEVSDVYDAVAGVAHLLVTPFVAVDGSGDSGATLPAEGRRWLEYVAELWKVDADQLQAKLVTHVRKVGDDNIESPLTTREANNKREALCKKVYNHVFDWLCGRLNERCGSTETKWIGMLDIFGFEAFPENSFEQFCINYANEKLQNYYCHTTSQLLNKYISEGVTPPPGLKDIVDNSDAIQLMEKIIGQLDDMCSNPKAHPTDNDFLQAVYQLAASRPPASSAAAAPPLLSRPGAKQAQDRFSFHHYADTESVTYVARDFLTKNAAKVPQDVLAVLALSGSPVLRGIHQPAPGHSATPTSTPPPQRATTPPPQRPASPLDFPPGPGFRREPRPEAQKPLAGKFRKDMTRLLNYMSDEAGLANLHWVRCIKPTHKEAPRHFEGNLVMKQLECVIPLLEVARVSQAVWVDHATFVRQFQLLLPKAKRTGNTADGIRALFDLLQRCPRRRGEAACFALGADLQIGRTQVCLNKDAYQRLQTDRRRRLMLYLLFAAGVVMGRARRLVRVTRGAALLEQAEEDEGRARHDLGQLERATLAALLAAQQTDREEVEEKVRRRLRKEEEADQQRRLQQRIEEDKQAAVQEVARRLQQEKEELQRQLEARHRAEAEAEAARRQQQLAEAEGRWAEKAAVAQREHDEATEALRQQLHQLQQGLQSQRTELEDRLRDKEAELQRERATTQRLAGEEADRLKAEVAGREAQLRQRDEQLAALRQAQAEEAEDARRALDATQQQLRQQDEQRRAADGQLQQLAAEVRRLQRQLEDEAAAHARELQASAAKAEREQATTERQLRQQLEDLRLQEEQRRRDEVGRAEGRAAQEREAVRAELEAEGRRAREQCAQQLEQLRGQLAAAARQAEQDVQEERRKATAAEQQWRGRAEDAERHARLELERALAEAEQQHTEERARQRLGWEAEAQQRSEEAVEEALQTARQDFQRRLEAEMLKAQRLVEEERQAVRREAEAQAALRTQTEAGHWASEKEELLWRFAQERDQLQWQYRQQVDQERRSHERERDALAAQMEQLEARLTLEREAALEQQRRAAEAQREAVARRLAEQAAQDGERGRLAWER
eukprot:EG_transcript_584